MPACSSVILIVLLGRLLVTPAFLVFVSEEVRELKASTCFGYNINNGDALKFSSSEAFLLFLSLSLFVLLS